MLVRQIIYTTLFAKWQQYENNKQLNIINKQSNQQGMVGNVICVLLENNFSLQQ